MAKKAQGKGKGGPAPAGTCHCGATQVWACLRPLTGRSRMVKFCERGHTEERRSQ